MDVPPTSPGQGSPRDLEADEADGQTDADEVVQEVTPKTCFDFSDLGRGNEAEVVLCDCIPIAAWSSMSLSIRVHKDNAPGVGGHKNA